jgi:predicted DNA binding CopG/RHH family protein
VAESASLVQDIGGKEKECMRSKINYTNAPADIESSLDGAVTVEDFLPAPSKLVRKVQKEKVTLAMDKHSLDLFRKYAKKHNTPYQPIINGVLSSYAERYLRR